MVAAPPRPRRFAAAPAAPHSKLVCFRVGGWRVGLSVDEVLGMFQSLPLIPTADAACAGEVQLPLGRVSVIDLRQQIGLARESERLLPTIVLVELRGELTALAVDLADEVIAVHPRAFLTQDLSALPLPARARTVTRYGDVFWLNLDELIAAPNAF
ncbi:MAG: chemotaxis protein CheW [bacterium]|nr:chemotaxis protein CheW [bacterium]